MHHERQIGIVVDHNRYCYLVHIHIQAHSGIRCIVPIRRWMQIQWGTHSTVVYHSNTNSNVCSYSSCRIFHRNLMDIENPNTLRHHNLEHCQANRNDKWFRRMPNRVHILQLFQCHWRSSSMCDNWMDRLIESNQIDVDIVQLAEPVAMHHVPCTVPQLDICMEIVRDRPHRRTASHQNKVFHWLHHLCTECMHHIDWRPHSGHLVLHSGH